MLRVAGKTDSVVLGGVITGVLYVTLNYFSLLDGLLVLLFLLLINCYVDIPRKKVIWVHWQEWFYIGTDTDKVESSQQWGGGEETLMKWQGGFLLYISTYDCMQ